MIESGTIEAVYPEFKRVVEIVSAQNPLQRKRIRAFIDGQDERYWTFAENLCRRLSHSFLNSREDWEAAGRSYNRTCKEILHLQIRFRESGTYPTEDARTANQMVYSQDTVMRSYITGLLFSYLFWPNHYRMLSFFQDHLNRVDVRRCLEVGVGHGLFTAEVKKCFPEADMTWVDISETSLSVAREMLKTYRMDPDEIRTIHGDYLAVDLESEAFDFLVMGEVLEHVDDAPRFLERARELLRPGGTIFVSTCANCPAVDHVWHFHNVKEIRDLIQGAGLEIVYDLALPADPVPECEWETRRVTVNYCGILRRAY